MYKLIFADDEAPVRRNIAKLIPWEKFGFELIGCCANGHEVLDLVEKDPPDLLITDINMPFVSGIDVARELRRDFPTVKIIFLTGYNDFNYAQQAIDLNVLKYILKPVSAQSLSECLQEVKQMLDAEYQQNYDRSRLEDFYRQNESIMQMVFLYALVTTGISNTEAKKKAELLGLNCLKGDLFQVAVLIEDGMRSEQWTDDSVDLMNFAVYNIAKEILERENIGTAIFNGSAVIAILSKSTATDTEHWQEKTVFALQEIREAIEKHLKFTITIGVGNTCSEYRSIHVSYDEAISALGYRWAIGTNKVIFIADIEPQRHSTLVFDKEKEQLLLDCMKINNPQKLEKAVDNLLLEAGKYMSIESLRAYIITIIFCVIREADNIRLDTKQLLELGDIRKVLECEQVEEMRKILLQVCNCMMKCISQNRKNSCSAAVTQAIQFIHEQLANDTLSVDMVAKHLHMSSSYFRAVFKKEVGATFGNYLTEQRMEKAKDLICTTALKNYEISEAVGYADPHYFSYCFKKHFKIAPNEMRESLN